MVFYIEHAVPVPQKLCPEIKKNSSCLGWCQKSCKINEQQENKQTTKTVPMPMSMYCLIKYREG